MGKQRELIEARIKSLVSKRFTITEKINDAIIEWIKLSDEKHRYKEEDEQVLISKRSKKVAKKRIGRLYWEEDFVDEDTGECIRITRSRIVSQDGIFVKNLFKIP